MDGQNKYKHRPVLHWAVLFLFLVGGIGLGGWQVMVHPETPLPDEWNPTRPLFITNPTTGLTQWKLRRALDDDQACLVALLNTMPIWLISVAFLAGASISVLIAHIWGAFRHRSRRGNTSAWMVCMAVVTDLVSDGLIFDMTRPFWKYVGSDFAARMATLDTPKSSSVIAVDFSSGQDTPVVPEELTASSGSWGAISARLKSLYPDQYKTWFARLGLLSDESDRYILSADSRFAAQYIETHLFKTLSQAIQSEVGARRVSIKALR